MSRHRRQVGQVLARVGRALGFASESRDGAYRLRLRGLPQIDGRALFDDTIEGNDEFQIRRARIELTGTVARRMSDFNGSTPTLLDAWLRWNARSRLAVEHDLFADLGYPTTLADPA